MGHSKLRDVLENHRYRRDDRKHEPVIVSLVVQRRALAPAPGRGLLAEISQGLGHGAPAALEKLNLLVRRRLLNLALLLSPGQRGQRGQRRVRRRESFSPRFRFVLFLLVGAGFLLDEGVDGVATLAPPALHYPAQTAHLEALHGSDRDHRVNRQRRVENAEEVDACGDAGDDGEEQDVHGALLQQRLELGPEHLLHVIFRSYVERGDGREIDARVPALAIVPDFLLLLHDFLFVIRIFVRRGGMPVSPVLPVQPPHVEDGEEQREDPRPQISRVAGHHEHAEVVRDDDPVDLIRPVLVHGAVHVLNIEHVQRRDVHALKSDVNSQSPPNPAPGLRPRFHVADVLDRRLALRQGSVAIAARVAARAEKHRARNQFPKSELASDYRRALGRRRGLIALDRRRLRLLGLDLLLRRGRRGRSPRGLLCLWRGEFNLGKLFIRGAFRSVRLDPRRGHAPGLREPGRGLRRWDRRRRGFRELRDTLLRGSIGAADASFAGFRLGFLSHPALLLEPLLLLPLLALETFLVPADQLVYPVRQVSEA